MAVLLTNMSNTEDDMALLLTNMSNMEDEMTLLLINLSNMEDEMALLLTDMSNMEDDMTPTLTNVSCSFCRQVKATVLLRVDDYSTKTDIFHDYMPQETRLYSDREKT